MVASCLSISISFFILCCNISGLFGQTSTVLIPASSTWKYLADGSNQGTNWRTLTFNDSSWPSGPAELGFGDSPSTTLTAGKIGYYFRKMVSITNPSQYSNFTMKFRRDDGIVVYVNNVEVLRNNMPNGTINFNTLAPTVCSDDGNTTFTVTIPTSNFLNGNNIIAAEVHNQSSTSSDVTFELQLIANLPVMCTGPNSLTTSNISSNSAKLNWSNVAGAVSYNVQYRIRNIAANYSTPINTTSTSLVLNNLQPSTNYEYIVQTVCSGNVFSPFTTSSLFTTLAIPPCSTPISSSLNTTNITANSANTFWSGVTGAISYNVEYRIRNIGAVFSLPINTTTPSLLLSNLQPSTDYEFIVQTVCIGNVFSFFSQSGLFTTAAVNSSTTLIAPNATWKYLADGSNQGINWKTSTFNDTTWPSGPAELGFGDLPATNITSGKIGYYFRKNININNPSQYSDFSIKFRRDDGIIVYVNNVEVIRNNMPQGTISYNTPAAANCSDDGNTVFTSIISNSNFINGNNIIAAEVHNQSTSSSDITFELQLIANLQSTNTCSSPNSNSLNTMNITSNSATLSWTAVTGVLSYNVQYRIRNTGAAWSSSLNTSSLSLVLNNLQPATDYEFIVQSVCAGNVLSAFTTSGLFTTIGSGIPVLLRGPYMTVATKSSITIQWRTNISTNSLVKYGINVSQLDSSRIDTNLNTEHSIVLSGLLANTKYFYSVGLDTLVLQGDSTDFFYTAPIDDSIQPVKFWVTGDFGDGSPQQLLVRNSFINYTANQIINGWIWLGDNAYQSGSETDYQLNVFNVYNSILKNTPVFPTPGNHDYAEIGYQSTSAMTTNFPYFNIFTLPSTSGTEKYYSTNYGNIHFISLDSYGSLNNYMSPMYNWLNLDLSNNTKQWTIVFFHHPPYTKSHHNSDTEIELINMRNNILPLLESYGVDLVMNGHSHNYERSFFIKNHFGLENTFNNSLYPAGNVVDSGAGPYTKTTANGTVYVVCGTSSHSAGSQQQGFPHNAMCKSLLNTNGSLILEVNGGQLSCKYLTSGDTLADEFIINKPIPVPMPFARISNSKIEKINPVIFPNPSTGDINIRMNNPELIQLKISIYNMSKMLVYENTFLKTTSEDIRIDKTEADLSSGIYMINISGENLNAIQKVVVY